MTARFRLTSAFSPWLRAEGAAVLVAAVWAYAALDASWWLFAGLLLAPDLAMLGYLRGPRVGALAYNVAHSYVGPALAAAVATVAHASLGWALALIWTAHIAMDRALGYGLKAATGFRDTHLGRLRGGA